MSRQIILDTETTGMDPKTGDKIVEIGCVEMINREITGYHFHAYINPERDMPVAAFNVHGLSEEFLRDKPLFSQVADEFLRFVNNDELIIHNAAFDMNFLDYELNIAKKPKLSDCCQVTDTLLLARKMYPGQRNSLDALCRRLDIDNTKRTLHGALLDSEILARVYLAMTGGQETLFSTDADTQEGSSDHKIQIMTPQSSSQHSREKTRIIYASTEELCQHEQFMQKINPAT